MGELTKALEAARAEVARLERAEAHAGCAEVGHRWVHIGGRNCGCGQCSIPVYECSRCKDCDYGENAEARDKIAKCALVKEGETR